MTELDRHMRRIRYEDPLDIEPRHALRPWAKVALWIVALFLLAASVCTWNGF